MRSNIRAGQSNIVAGSQAIQEATAQFRGSNCFEERRAFMGNEEKKNITIADVAEALGVSKTTVSRAISGKGRIGQETRDRVLKYIEEHDYKPNVIAKGLAQSKTYNLCVVMPGEYDVVDLTFFQECLFGIQEIAGIMEYDILLSICKNNDISSLERIISNRKVDGVILMRTFVEDRQIEYLQEKKVPFVKQVYEVYKNSDVFVMPSVSEPFGIAPLEAMQCGTPSIISKQSGCGEILDKVIKTDYWDIHAMADAIYSICTNPSLFQYLQEEGKREVDGITWEKVGLRIRALYEDVLRNYGK